MVVTIICKFSTHHHQFRFGEMLLLLWTRLDGVQTLILIFPSPLISMQFSVKNTSGPRLPSSLMLRLTWSPKYLPFVFITVWRLDSPSEMCYFLLNLKYKSFLSSSSLPVRPSIQPTVQKIILSLVVIADLSLNRKKTLVCVCLRLLGQVGKSF